MASAVAGKMMLLGIGGAMAVSAKAAIDFESSMAGVAKTTDLAGNSFDRNSGPLFQFGEALRSLSMRIPVNVNDLARIAELGGQLGVEVPNLIEFTEVMAAMGVSTNMSAEEAATGFARFANIMRTPQSDFERLGSIVVELGNNLATTESEILKFGTRIAPIGRVVGATEEEVFALSGALTSLGVPAERGGTAIQKWFILAKQAVDQGGGALEDFAKVAGMTADQFGELFAESPGRAFAAFVEGLDEISRAGGDVFGTLQSLQLAEVRTTQVLLAAAGGVDILTNSLDMADEAGEEVNALFEEAGRRYGTTASSIQLLSNSFNDLRIEIGNMILGSGGLAFTVDVVREFFGIIKDNLPVISRFVTLAGILVAIRAGFWFAELAQKGIAAAKTMYGVSAAASALTTSARLTQGGLQLLTLGMQGMLGIAGAVATIWALQAVNAAQLKAEIKGLQDQIDDGADAFEVFHDSVEQSLSDKDIQRLHDLGLSTQDLTRFLMDGKNAASEVGQVLDEVLRPRDVQAMSRDELQRAGQDAVRLGQIIDKADEKISGFMDVKRTELRNSLIESGQAGDLTIDKMDELADKAIKLFGYDVTGDQFVKSVRAFIGDLSGGRKGFGSGFRGFTDELQTEMAKVQKTWIDFLAPEEKNDILEDFFEGNIESVAAFQESLDDRFEEIGETVREGFPVWDEYEKVVLGAGDTLGFKKILDAQEAFLEDTEDWISRMPDIMDMGASAATVDWIDSLEAPVRGAIGRLNDAQLQELIDGANANFDALHALHVQRWLQIYPESAKLGFAAMVGELGTTVKDMNLPGEQAAEAFGDGLETIMMALPEQHKAAFLEYLKDALPDKEWAKQNGFELNEEWIRGILQSMGGLAGRVGQKFNVESRKLKDRIEDSWGVRSPSTWWANLGEQWEAGLKKGAGNMGLGSIGQMVTPESLFPNVGTLTQNVNVGGGGTSTRTTNISIVSPQTQNLRGDIQQGLLADSLVSEVEGF